MASREEYNNLFEFLKQVRLDKNIALKTIANDSRIQLSYLEALEEGAFEKIPEVYDKLFFRTYIAYLNLENPEIYIEEFKSLRKSLHYPTPTTTIKKIKTQPKPSGGLLTRKTLFFAGPIVLIVLVLGIMAWNSQSFVENDTQKIKELPVRKIAEEIEARQKAKADSVKKVEEVEQHIKKVDIKLSAVEKTWLRFIKDRADTNEYMLSTGNVLNIEADSIITFVIGNAAGLNFKVNGEELGLIGKQNEVISYLKVTEKGIVTKRIRPPKPKRSENDSLTLSH